MDNFAILLHYNKQLNEHKILLCHGYRVIVLLFVTGD